MDKFLHNNMQYNRHKGNLPRTFFDATYKYNYHSHYRSHEHKFHRRYGIYLIDNSMSEFSKKTIQR